MLISYNSIPVPSHNNDYLCRVDTICRVNRIIINHTIITGVCAYDNIMSNRILFKYLTISILVETRVQQGCKHDNVYNVIPCRCTYPNIYSFCARVHYVYVMCVHIIQVQFPSGT